MSNKDVKYINPEGKCKVRVLCWDGIEYTRDTDKDEIKNLDADKVFRVENNMNVFDFRIYT